MNTGFKNEDKKHKLEIVWINVMLITLVHVGGIYGLYLLFYAKWQTNLWTVYLTIINAYGITAGTHRLWTHKTYKAKLPLQLLLLYFQTSIYQNSVYVWCRDHRVHHKFTDTDADPHNSRRGFFFSHVGWLMTKKHKDVIEKGSTVWLKDLEDDPLVMFQHRYYYPLVTLFTVIIPTFVPWYFWGETLKICFFTSVLFRYMFALNGTWSVNSLAHLYGSKPYDITIEPRENRFVSFVAVGEGWHNYHHVFPWDYKAGEFGGYRLNWTTAFIDFMAKIGWAYDLKTVPEDVVRKRMMKTGEMNGDMRRGDVDDNNNNNNKNVWGWDDESMEDEDIKTTKIFYKDKE